MPDRRCHGHEWDGRAWLGDEALSSCSFTARAVWADMVSLMLLSPEIGRLVYSGGAPWSEEDIIAAVRGDKSAVRDALAELLRKSVASRDEGGVVYCRKLVRQERQKRATQGRVYRHRKKRACNAQCNADVTRSVFNKKSSDLSFLFSKTGKTLLEWQTVIYEAYPRKQGKKDAFKHLERSIREGADPKFILERTQAFASSPAGNNGEFVPHASSWFNQESWNDDPAAWQRANGHAKPASLFDKDKAILMLEEGRHAG